MILPGDTEKPEDHHGVGKPVTVGNRKGYEIVERETLRGQPFLVVTVHLDLPRSSGESDYVSMTLISPTNTYAAHRRVFDGFISSLRFW